MRRLRGAGYGRREALAGGERGVLDGIAVVLDVAREVVDVGGLEAAVVADCFLGVGKPLPGGGHYRHQVRVRLPEP